MKKPLEQRFWKHVRKGTNNECWLWIASTNEPNGYGQINDGTGKMITAHRYSWIIHNGVIPDGMQVCHRCDVRRCVNPAHLFVGTQQDNLKDRGDKRRTQMGEKHYCAKLSEKDVREIRSSTEYQRVLAERFGVSRSTIAMIQTKKSWKSC